MNAGSSIRNRWLAVHLRIAANWSLIAALLLAGCDPPQAAPPDFLNRSEPRSSGQPVDPTVSLSEPGSKISVEQIKGALGDSIYRNGSELGMLFLPETTGGGIGIADYDRDGRPDVICAGGGKPEPATKSMLGYAGSLCRGLEGLRFVLCNEPSHFDLSAIYNAAIAVADYDADGFPDVLVTGYSGTQLLRNQGDGTWEWIPNTRSGLIDPQWSSAAAFFDADNDGLLDLYVANYANWSYEFNPVCQAPAGPGAADPQNGNRVQGGTGEQGGSGVPSNPSTQSNPAMISDYCGPREFRGLTDVMYRNSGDGAFVDSSAAMGIDEKLRGLGVLAADLDGDGDVDVYVANDVDPNLLYRNDGNMQFTEVARRSGVACNDNGTPEGSMGIALGDYNLDGKFDLWVTNYQNEVGALYRNNGNLLFNYASNLARIPSTDESAVGWGTAFVDMDLDGDEDVLIVNGHIEMRAVGSTFQQRPQILENVDGKYYRLVPRNSEYLSEPQSSRALAMADFNGDGRMDYVVSRLNTEAALVVNQSQATGRALSLRLVGTQSNRDAVGAVIRLRVGDRTWIRQRSGGGSYAASHDSVAHFGVPESMANADAECTIDWPSGHSQKFSVTQWNTEQLVIEGQ